MTAERFFNIFGTDVKITTDNPTKELLDGLEIGILEREEFVGKLHHTVAFRWVVDTKNSKIVAYINPTLVSYGKLGSLVKASMVIAEAMARQVRLKYSENFTLFAGLSSEVFNWLREELSKAESEANKETKTINPEGYYQHFDND